MDSSKKGWTLGEIAAELGGQLHGPPDLPVSRPVPADADDPHGIAFAESERFLAIAESSMAGSLLVPPALEPKKKPYIVVPSPRAAFGRLLQMWKRPLPIIEGIHPLASVHPDAAVDASAFVGPFAVIERGAQVGPGARIYSFAYIGEDCTIGEGASIFPHAVLYQDVSIGARTIVHSGAILGADGFGFDWNGTEQIKVPQIGSVVVGADAEIGANTCIDRATAGATKLGSDVKLDNLVQVGHNVSIGAHTVIAGLTGISGSSEIGQRVTMGGACGITHHVKIGNDIVLGGRAGVANDLEEPGEYWGTPARPMLEAMKASLLVLKLPELQKRIRDLEKRIQELSQR